MASGRRAPTHSAPEALTSRDVQIPSVVLLGAMALRLATSNHACTLEYLA